jgi:hypothetical protein
VGSKRVAGLGLDADDVRFVGGFGHTIMEERERQMELEAAHESALARRGPQV